MASGDEFPLADNNEDKGHVVNCRIDDLAILNYATDNLVGVLFKLELVIPFLDEISLDSTPITT